ncbi:DNA polymerase-3 subunit beta [Pontimonas salivibrio]|uniref:Beta sliding clamp n=1 Tax=Pontimonas salivibrio TaxID=1159327 RepID=A0A2L2BNC8_9MICO|nr:DNA polymerase III subunit beta [Pontimonas salivibrio]AVG23138.1 DNA polymerase-3 subunit beta [Pontimonas salivibrio]
MKLTVHRDVFADAVSFAVKLLPQRTTLPILSGVLLHADQDSLTLSSFDYEVSARTSVAADIQHPGHVLVSGRLLSDIAQRLPQQDVTLELDGSSMKVVCGSAKFSLLTMPIEEYPQLPEVSGVSGEVSGDDFGHAIAQVSPAASRDDVTPVITGVLLHITDENLALMATDRYRVAVREMPWASSESGLEVSALVPSKTLSEVGKTFQNADKVNITIMTGAERELVAFSADDKTVTSLLIKGSFPPVQRLFPESVDNYCVVNTAELIEATRRVGLVVEREAPLRYSFSADGVMLEALGSEQAQASETTDGHLVGEDCVVSLKPQFLIDGLSHTGSEFARVGFSPTDNPNKPGPVLITAQTSREGDQEASYRYLLQPNLLMR